MVRSTRRRSYAKRSTMKIPRYASTLSGLEGWFKAMHEKLGWMTLVKAKGKHYKVTAYKRSLGELIKSIEHVMSEYTNMNRIHDLKVLHMEAKALQAYVMKHL